MKNLTLNKINFAGARALSREELKKVMGGSPANGSYTGCEGQTRFECEMDVLGEMGDDVPSGIAESLLSSSCGQCAEVRPV